MYFYKIFPMLMSLDLPPHPGDPSLISPGGWSKVQGDYVCFPTTILMYNKRDKHWIECYVFSKSLNDEREVGLHSWRLCHTFLNAELHVEWENVQFW